MKITNKETFESAIIQPLVESDGYIVGELNETLLRFTPLGYCGY